MVPKLSIVLATRGREYYCIKSVLAMLTFIDKTTEIVISDNSISSEIKLFVEGLNDSRIKYCYNKNELTMSDNYNKGIELASGNFICMVGDDDIVLPNIYNVLGYAVKNDIDCITQKKVINYIWPNESQNGILYLPKFTYSYKILENNNAAEYVAHGCCVNPRDYKLPALYHGLIKKTIIDSVRRDRGKVIGGISPDSYIAVTLSKYVKKQVEVDLPFSIGGACSKSATASNISGKHCGKLTDSAQYVANVKRGYVWDCRVPNYYSIQTIWADSALHAVTDEKVFSLFSIERLTARAIVENRKVASDIVSKTKKFVKSSGINIKWGQVCLFAFEALLNKIFNRINNKISNRLVMINNIGEIVNLLDKKHGVVL